MADVQHTVENPSTATEQEQANKYGFTPAELQKILTEIVAPYRRDWSAFRAVRLPRWLKNTEFDKGNQILAWDPGSKTYFDALAWYRQQGNNGEGVDEYDDERLDWSINNITQMLRTAFQAALCRSIPPVRIQPEDARNLSDVTTSQAASKAMAIVERFNHQRRMQLKMTQYLYLYGVYFRRTRFVIDGSWAGYRQEPIFGEKEVQLTKDHFHCFNCGTDTEAMAVDPATPQCPACSAPLRPQDYYPGETGTVIAKVDEKEVPNGMVKQSVYPPMQIDADPNAQSPRETPILCLDEEIDIAQLRATYPREIAKIKEGATSPQDPNASYARLVRSLIFGGDQNAGLGSTSGATQTTNQKPTHTTIWIQPEAYYRTSDQQLIDKLVKTFPKGMKMAAIGDFVPMIAPAVLEREWTACVLHEGYGLFPPSIADNVVPYNERFNNASFILEDYMERSALGIVLVNGEAMDANRMNGKQLSAGVMNEVSLKGEAGKMSMEEVIKHIPMTMDANLFNYMDRLMNLVQLISGVPPQVFGAGTTEGVETFSGQRQMLDQALGKLSIFWANQKDEYASAGQNAIECLQKNMEATGELWSVIEEEGSQFRNDYVHMEEMQGRIRVFPETDEGLPQSAEQRRDLWKQLLLAADKNPIVQKFFDSPTNQRTGITALGLENAVIPGADQEAKTLQDIRKLLESGAPQSTIGPDGQEVLLPTIEPEKQTEDYVTARATIAEFCRENSDLRQTNPEGWQNLMAFDKLLQGYETDVETDKAKRTLQVQMAGQPAPPPPPPPDPTIQAAKLELIRDAQRGVQRLLELAEMPPLGKNQSITAQVSAADSIIRLAEAASTA